MQDILPARTRGMCSPLVQDLWKMQSISIPKLTSQKREIRRAEKIVLYKKLECFISLSKICIIFRSWLWVAFWEVCSKAFWTKFLKSGSFHESICRTTAFSHAWATATVLFRREFVVPVEVAGWKNGEYFSSLSKLKQPLAQQNRFLWYKAHKIRR